MNLSIIRRIIGYVIALEGAMMLLPTIVALCYGESEIKYFLITALICMAFGILTALPKPKNTVFYLKEGCVATALSWVMLSIFGCLPFFISGTIPSFVNALFETVSGFTTTGASILHEVESLPKCILFWRSFTHWIGGMGILVFVMAILPLSGGSNINLLRAESPGPSVGKLVPKMRTTALSLYGIYVGLSVLQHILLMLGGMKFLDAMMVMFGTAGTGGFGIKNDSIASYSTYIQWVIIVFMMLFGINFSAYFLALTGKIKKAFSLEEVHWYLIIIAVCTATIFASLHKIQITGFEALTEAAFQVTSIITTTGFTTADFDTWPELSKAVILFLMFTGACAGSTGGGLKVSRLIVMIKSVFKEINSYIHPKSIKKVKMDRKPLDDEVVRSTNAYILTILLVFIVSFLLVAIDNNDVTSSATAVLTTLNNVGPGLGKNGPAQNFDFYSSFSKLVLAFDMLAGRLELFPMLLLFNGRLWIETFKQENSRRRINKKPKN